MEGPLPLFRFWQFLMRLHLYIELSWFDARIYGLVSRDLGGLFLAMSVIFGSWPLHEGTSEHFPIALFSIFACDGL